MKIFKLLKENIVIVLLIIIIIILMAQNFLLSKSLSWFDEYSQFINMKNMLSACRVDYTKYPDYSHDLKLIKDKLNIFDWE